MWQGKFCPNCGSYKPVVGYYVHNDTVAYSSYICEACGWDTNEPESVVYPPFSRIGSQVCYAIDTLKNMRRTGYVWCGYHLCDWCF